MSIITTWWVYWMFQSKQMLKREGEGPKREFSLACTCTREWIYTFSALRLRWGREKKASSFPWKNSKCKIVTKLSLSWFCFNDFNFHWLFRLWRFGILNDFETTWDRFSSVALNWVMHVEQRPASHPQTLHSMKVTQTFRNVFIHQSRTL